MHISEEIILENDPHTVVPGADFSALDRLYALRQICFGDYHAHSDSGGKSDGKTTPEQWLQAMERLQMDFVGLMDHKQVRHMYLDSFDEDRFLCGTEPAGKWLDPELKFHYLMLVPEPACLVRVLERFTDVFEFTGGTEGTFVYNRIEKARFLEVVRAVQAEGGAVVHAHPRQVMESDDPMDYYFGEESIIEIIYAMGDNGVGCADTVDNYKLWMALLERGCKVINTATSDCHTTPTNTALNAVYSDRKTGRAYLEYLKKGDLNAGFIGIQMSVDTTPVGAVTTYAPGKKLYIRLADVHPQRFDPAESYRLDVITDRGLAYSEVVRLPMQLALEVQERKFYRAVVIAESDGSPAAIGNPIWLE